MIRLNNVNKYFNRKKRNEIHAIDHTSIELGDKGLVTFLGNSGCGKTTLLNAIGGLDKVDSGDIYIDDQRITKRSDSKKDEIRNIHVGYIFQNYNLIEDATVFENVALVLRMMGIKDKQEIENRVMYILTRVGIERYKNRPAKMLSGGERQRVGIARAIVKNPKIIIADEPTGNLDSKNTIEIMNIIKAISREKLVILVTHEREIAQFYADRVIEIVDGKIVSDKENAHDDDLDYRLENKIYLQDMPIQKEMAQDNVKIQYYGDKDDFPLEVKIVIKNNNIYVQTDSSLAEGSQAMELVDDHYKAISRDIYEEYEFNYDALIEKGFTPSYTSIYTLNTMLVSGYKKILNYSIIKKILLVGFILASMFVIYSVSNICGITNITNDKFLTTHEDYVTINTGKLSPRELARYEKMEGIDYALPGDGAATFSLPMDDYYQTANIFGRLNGALASQDKVKEEQVLAGGLTTEKQSILVDKMVIDNLLKINEIQQIGVKNYSDFIGRIAQISLLKDFTIAGIVDTGSPCIYVHESMMMDILSNGVAEEGAEDEGQAEAKASMVNYDLVKDNEEIQLYAGSLPTKTGEAMIHENYRYEKAIGSTLDEKVNGKKLIVCGYYSDKRQGNAIYVNQKTAYQNFLQKEKNVTLAPADKGATIETLKSKNVNFTDNYEDELKQYKKSINKQVIATLLMALIMMAISLIEIYLMLRSSFLSRIKEVGVLRAIGLKKKDIYKMFAGEIVALTTVTALPAMAFMAYVLNGISKIPLIGDDYLMNPAVFFASFAIVFAFNLIAGLMPVFTTTRKTPAEILSRNDVN
ncbi:putative ABC transport system permease protein [Clostridiales Family XIII bacterium PM5-7]